MALDSPAIDSTDRSISPAMMISVIGRAMIATSIRAARRFAEVGRRQEERREGVAEHDQPEQRDEQERLPARERPGSTIGAR